VTLDVSGVGVVSVGDELLAGAHSDLNAPYLAHRMLEFGRRVRRVVVVGDDERDIAAAADGLAAECALVLVSGGTRRSGRCWIPIGGRRS
jgi:molybdopterin-biosynthesis enzyme MoeA-like protein